MARRKRPDQLELDLSPQRQAQTKPPEQPPRVSHPAGRRPTAADLLVTPGALLSRSHLRELGWERRGVDAIFRALPVVAVDGYSRPVIQVADYLGLLERSTYRGDRVRP
jgi:hypothetical protein